MLRTFLHRNDLGYVAKAVLILLIMFCCCFSYSWCQQVGTPWNCIFDWDSCLKCRLVFGKNLILICDFVWRTVLNFLVIYWQRVSCKGFTYFSDKEMRPSMATTWDVKWLLGMTEGLKEETESCCGFRPVCLQQDCQPLLANWALSTDGLHICFVMCCVTCCNILEWLKKIAVERFAET
jgi:hypothetical protein